MIGSTIFNRKNALAGGLLLAALAAASPASSQGYACPPSFTLVPAYYAPGYACVPDAYFYQPPYIASPPFVGSIIVFDRFRRFDHFDHFHRFDDHDFRFNHFGGSGHFHR
jgi:hypothetical protein